MNRQTAKLPKFPNPKFFAQAKGQARLGPASGFRLEPAHH